MAWRPVPKLDVRESMAEGVCVSHLVRFLAGSFEASPPAVLSKGFTCEDTFFCSPSVPITSPAAFTAS